MVHPMTSIHPDARIHPSVEIGPFVTIHGDVEIGEGTVIHSNVTIMDGARIGKNVTIYPGAVISGAPQDLKFAGEVTTAIIGDGTTIRECVTIHRGTASKGKTIVGSNCLIMAYCHVAHDCCVGNNVIMSNAVQMAGEVIVDDFAVIGGGALIQRHTPLRQSRTRTYRLLRHQLNRPPPPRLLKRRHPRHPGNLPLPLPLRTQQLRRNRTHRSRTPRHKRTRRNHPLRPQLKTWHPPRLRLIPPRPLHHAPTTPPLRHPLTRGAERRVFFDKTKHYQNYSSY